MVYFLLYSLFYPNIGFRFYNMFGPTVDLSYLLKLNNIRVLYLDSYTDVSNIAVLEKLNLTSLHLSCFGIKNYAFLSKLVSTIQALSIDLENKTYKMDINDILHMKDLKSLEIRNVKKGLDKIVEFKKLSNLLLRFIDIKDYSFLQDMNVKSLSLCFQKSEYFNTFGMNTSIEEIRLWRNPKLTNLGFLLQFSNLKRLIITDQSKINHIPDLTSLKKLEEVYFLYKDAEEIKKYFNSNVKIYPWYNPCDID